MFGFQVHFDQVNTLALAPWAIGLVLLPLLLAQLPSRHLAILARLFRGLGAALVLAVLIGTVNVYAFDMFRECDFETLVAEYGYWVAWAWWVTSQCYI
jgi:hypothetical protein